LPGKSLCASFASGGGDAWVPKGLCQTNSFSESDLLHQ